MRISVLLFLALACVYGTYGQTNSSGTVNHSAKRPQGFFDYALGKVNPNGTDYGASLESKRNSVVEHTADDLYFWSNVVTLLLLTGAAGAILFQWRAADKREVVVSAIIAQLWNGRVSDGIELDRRTRQFNELVERHNTGVERALSAPTARTEPAKEPAGTLSRNVQKLSGTDTSPGERRSARNPGSPNEIPPAVSPANSPDVQQSTALLQRQNEAMQNTVQNLKQRLNQTTLLLDEERRRNAALKGA